MFNFTINYNDPEPGATALFNGDISQTKWKTASDNVERWYKYGYDALNRITSAKGLTDRYDLNNVSYDKMGNITALSRNGHRNVEASNFGVMDDLTYSYDNGNKLMRISDAATIDQFGFKDDVVGSTPDTANDYTYDVNGNMLTDTNKGITSNILYNHLSLPTQINVKGQVINYTYDAAGNKLKKVTNGVTTEYAGNYRYVGGELKDFKHPEGYVKNDGGTFNYVYSYTDHLGNVRLNYADLNNDGVIQAATEILDEKNYYPFGGTHEGYNTAINGAYYPFGYNGKEENDENGLATLDFGARNYDKWAGRWMNLDPLADQMRRHSPYNYAFDNPVYFIDPDGMKPVDWKKNSKGTYVYDENLTKENASTNLEEGETYVGEKFKDVKNDYEKNKTFSQKVKGFLGTENVTNHVDYKSYYDAKVPKFIDKVIKGFKSRSKPKKIEYKEGFVSSDLPTYERQNLSFKADFEMIGGSKGFEYNIDVGGGNISAKGSIRTGFSEQGKSISKISYGFKTPRTVYSNFDKGTLMLGNHRITNLISIQFSSVPEIKSVKNYINKK